MVASQNKLTVKVLEVGELDALAHAQNISSRAQAVEHHPEVSGVQGRHGLSGLLRSVTHARQSVLNVSPSRNNRTQHHQSEREESHWCDCATEPKNLSVCDQDDGQVLENGVDGNRKVLERPGTGVDHADEQDGDGEP